MSKGMTANVVEVISPKPRQGWQPGQSGNPGGKKKGVPKISAAIERILCTGPDEVYEPKNKADLLALQLYDSAMKGDTWASREILDRTEGKVAQGLQLSTAELPTAEIVERLVEAFSAAGIGELQARKVLMLLGDHE